MKKRFISSGKSAEKKTMNCSCKCHSPGTQYGGGRGKVIKTECGGCACGKSGGHIQKYIVVREVGNFSLLKPL